MAWVDQILGRRWPARTKSRGNRQPAVPGMFAGQMNERDASAAHIQLPKFRSTAGERARRTSSNRFEEMREHLCNAFTPSQPVSDRKAFAGRADVLDKLIRATEDLRVHTVLYGERGLGKTSVLHMFAEAALDARYLVVHISCGTHSAFEEIVRSIASRIPLLYCRGIPPNSQDTETGRTFADLLPTGALSAQTASDVLINVIGTRVLIILDEFDQCQSREFRLAIAELLKNLSDRAARVQFLIAGVAANVTELIEHIPSIERNVFALQLLRMPPSEVAELVRLGECIAGLQYEQVVADIVDVANGFPYFATLLAYHSGLQAIDERRSNVSFENVLAAMGTILDQFRGRLSHRTRTQLARIVSSTELRILGQLASVAQMHGNHFELGNIREFFPDRSEQTRCQMLIERLSATESLVAADTGADATAYYFLDETAIPYLWLLSAHTELLSDRKSTITDIGRSRVDAAINWK